MKERKRPSGFSEEPPGRPSTKEPANEQATAMADRKKYRIHRFDFEIGHLKMSPCKTCLDHYRFPSCMNVCSTLDRIQTRLARTVMTTCNYSPMENFAIHIDERREK
jgi:hypothetical protein